MTSLSLVSLMHSFLFRAAMCEDYRLHFIRHA